MRPSLRQTIAATIQRLLAQTAHSPLYLPLVAVLAAAATLSMSVPTTALLAPAVLLRPRRWITICIAAVAGAACAATLLTWSFHNEGWERLVSAYPDMEQAESWRMVTSWITRYGLPALALICALPLPQTPALIMCGVTDLPPGGVFLAVAAGKLAKYGVVSWAVASFPERFIHYLRRAPSVPPSTG